MIDAFGIVLVGGAGIFGKAGEKRRAFVLRQKRKKGIGAINRQMIVRKVVGKAADRIGVTVAMWQIGLDIVDRRLIQQVCT